MLLQPVRAILNRLENKVGKHVVRREVQVFANDKRTLDLGCGRSPNADAFPNRVGVDVAPDRGVDVMTAGYLLVAHKPGIPAKDQ
jgi:hypothetical protein